MTPLEQAVEWLERTRREATGPAGDWASELLNELDVCAGERELLECVSSGRLSGEDDAIDGTIGNARRYEAVYALCEQAGIVGEQCDDLPAVLRMFLPL